MKPQPNPTFDGLLDAWPFEDPSPGAREDWLDRLSIHPDCPAEMRVRLMADLTLAGRLRGIEFDLAYLRDRAELDSTLSERALLDQLEFERTVRQ